MSYRSVADNLTLLVEWDYTKNGDLDPSSISAKSSLTVWWKCKEGHSWKTRIEHRSNGSKCPYCSGKIAIPGKNDLNTLYPVLAESWNYTKNRTMPNEYLPFSNKKVWWICNYKHEWESTIANRHNNGCPYCANKKVLKGFNDLVTTNPELSKEWDFKKNNSHVPEEYTKGSSYKAYWLCKSNHSWLSRIADRAKGESCPYCSNKRVLQGYNDLYTLYPDVAKEWHPTKNSLSPKDVTAHSSKKAWWICSKGHEWETVISYRTSLGTNCPICNNKGTSFHEKLFTYYIKSVFPNVIENYRGKELGGKEIDIYLPKYRIGIEYDGPLHNLERDILKNKICESNGIHLIRIRSNKLPSIEGSINYILADETDQSFKDALMFLQRCLTDMISDDNNISFDVDIQRDRPLIMGVIEEYVDSKSLSTNNKTLSSEFHPTLNKVTPDQVYLNSKNKYWWLGKCGHEWQATVASRNKGSGCPYCSSHKVLFGFNDLYTTNLSLSNEWDCEKNLLSPRDVTINSNRVVWWKCCKGHSWKAKISQRAHGSKCPYCQGIIPIIGVNDFKTLYPTVSMEWHPTLNGKLKPEDFTKSSGKIVWWKCKKCNYAWKSSIANRSKGSGCPVCANRITKEGINDLATKNPVLCRFWDYEKNVITPSKVTCGSSKSVFWKCPQCNYSWKDSVNNMSYKKRCNACGYLINRSAT